MARGKQAIGAKRKPRPEVVGCYPGERELRFKAALAGARLATFLRERGHDSLADHIGHSFRLDRLNQSSDAAEFLANDLAKYVNAAAERINDLRAHRKAYFEKARAA